MNACAADTPPPSAAPRQSTRRRTSFTTSLEPAFGLGAIDSQRVELRYLVQEAFLRGDRDDGPPVAEQDRLAQLQVPVAQGELLSLERREREVGPFEKIEQGLCVDGTRARAWDKLQ